MKAGMVLLGAGGKNVVKKRLILFAVILLLVGGGWFIYQQWAGGNRDSLKIQGNVDIRQVNLGFRVSGRIREMRFEEGDPVRAGDLIAVLDEGPYQDQVNLAKAQLAQSTANLTKAINGSRPQEIDQARAQVAQAQANVENADLTFQRESDLRRTNAISKQELDNATATRDANRAQLRSAQANLALLEAGSRQEDIEAARALVQHDKANLETAELNLSDCKLLAPTDGMIITRALEPGAIVAAGTNVYSICLYSPVWIRTYVDERDLGRIYPGMKALVYTDTNPEKPYQGQIGFISPVAEFTPKTVETRELRTDLVYRLRVVVQHPDRYLRQGMPVTVRLVDDGTSKRNKD
jgi:HlyD family secretion protein